MNKKLIQAVKDKYGKQNTRSSKSRSRSKAKLISPKMIQSAQTDKNLMFNHVAPEVKRLSSFFIKEVQTPINLYQQIFKANNPQKCLQHNNITSLYCINDKKPLCAMCMYQTNIHKPHKVIPLNKAPRLMEQELKQKLSYVQTIGAKCGKLVKRCQQNLISSQKQYPQLMQKLHAFYMDLHQLLIDRKNQQLKYLNQIWSQVRYCNHTMRMELKRITDYINYRVKEITERKEEDHLLFNLNIAHQLAKLEDIISDKLCPIETNKYFEELKQFKKLNIVMGEVLIFSKYEQHQATNESRLSRRNSHNQFKKDRDTSNLKKSLEHSFQKQLQKSKDKDNKQLSGRNPLPKNRHNTSQLKLKIEVSQRKRQFQIKKRKKSVQLTKSKSKSKLDSSPIPAKSPKSPSKKSISKMIKK